MRWRSASVVAIVSALMLAPQAAAGTVAVSTVAVFPIENLSGAGIPAADITRLLESRLVASKVRLLPGTTLGDFLTRHRIRYAAGLDGVTAAALAKETGSDAALFVSVELSSTLVPPKIALTARLVTLGTPPAVVWADDVGLSGDDSPGLLGLGLVSDYSVLLARALDRLSSSLVRFIETGERPADVRRAGKFAPKVAFRSLTVEPGRVHTVAVLPFFNLSDRRNAGEILALLFMRHLSAFDGFSIVDTGDVRRQLLQARIIMDGGISLADADVVAGTLEADFVLGGRVISYQDYEGGDAIPRVDFSTVLFDRKTRAIVWSSHQDNNGRDGVHFFERGRSMTAHVMATQMVRLATEHLAQGRK